MAGQGLLLCSAAYDWWRAPSAPSRCHRPASHMPTRLQHTCPASPATASLHPQWLPAPGLEAPPTLLLFQLPKLLLPLPTPPSWLRMPFYQEAHPGLPGW